MRRRLLSVRVLLFFFLTCSACGCAYAGGISRSRSVDLWPGNVRVLNGTSGGVTGKFVQQYKSPSLVASGGVMVAIAEAQHMAADGSVHVAIAAKDIDTDGAGWADDVTGDNASHWRTQLVAEKVVQRGHLVFMRQPQVVATNDRIFVFFPQFETKKTASEPQGRLTCEFEMVVGEVRGGAQETPKTIEWKSPRLSLSDLSTQMRNLSLVVPPFFFYRDAFVTEDGKVVFVFTSYAKNGKFVTTIAHSESKRDLTKVALSYVGTPEDCYNPFIFGWGAKLIMITDCRHGVQKVRESGDTGRTWRDAEGSISRLGDILHRKGHFTTVTIENRTVLLYEEFRGEKTGIKNGCEIHLWVTDTNRVHDVGPIVTDVDLVTPAGLLYTNGELFSLHQRWENERKATFLTRLKDEVKKIAFVLNTWAKVDAYLSKPCSETAPKGASPDTLCVTPMPTDGLVGFLSNKGHDATHWHDDYRFRNATVKGGRKVKNGFTFTGANSGARWSLERRGLGNWYNFTGHGLTVVAMVAIHEIPQGNAPLLTIGEVSNSKRLGLWYTKAKQWRVVATMASPGTGLWETNTTYRVGLVLYNNNVSVYVDGRPVGVSSRLSAFGEDWSNIENLFIGRYEDDVEDSANVGDRVTVTNVFLYNRQLGDFELGALGKRVGDS